MAVGDTVPIKSMAELNELFKTTTYVVIDFYADWCGPCKTIAPELERMAKQHSLPGLLAIAKVNVDHALDVARQYNISAMPTFLCFKEGRQVAVNGHPYIQGADLLLLKTSIEKLSALAQKKHIQAAAL
ncbi:hypothetical protein PG993_005047 [Apiospora rasikravindrae]|uniref:Thioredoxin domain-containing protein n=1 Tax=Apiospora rasikravindrae TaxID=990691 RepID=A0ABR1TEJ9_9PEZI